eukprot:2851784-Alexandrium_andersonii.AAC.1
MPALGEPARLAFDSMTVLFTNCNDERGALCGCGPCGFADGDNGRLSRPCHLLAVLGAEHH